MNETLLTLSDKEFRDIATLVYERFGIHLTDQKRTLVAGRLSKRVRILGLRDLGSYLSYVHADKSGKELIELVNRITTNHSYFYREKEHFEYLAKTVLPALKPKLAADRTYPLRLWSAGCATGEEPYTIAMAVKEALGASLATIDWGILATDLSHAALHDAQKGIYQEARLRELPPAWKTQNFDKVGSDQWEVKQDLRRPILFKTLNLMNEHFPFKGQFDVIFCRNVMIYFDAPVRRALVDRLHRYVKPGGYFFVGHSESLPRDTCPFEYIGPATYRKSALGEVLKR
ncbi:protein-glutamate O-methyltransferase [Treponema sp.]